MKNIKKLVLLFCAFLSVATVLSSCSDDSSDDNNTTTSTVASVITVENLKSYVGQSHSQISSSITSKGYTLTSTEHPSDGSINYIYSSAQSLTGGKQCIIGEYNNVIYTAAFAEAGLSRTSVLPTFKILSDNAYNTIYQNLTYDYMGDIMTNGSVLDYDTHNDFISAYNSFTSFENCSEMYSFDSETEMTQAMISYMEASAKTTYCAVTAMYVNYLLSPSIVNKSNIQEFIKYRF